MSQEISDAVKDQYGAVARSSLSGEQQGVRDVARAFGYSEGELGSIPAEANMGLSCGNPTAFASLREGEVVVDLGCGGGIDVLLAAGKVGPAGRAIGIDMTPAMIERAKKNAAKAGANNVEFHLASIDALPLADRSVDVIISNCVINLAPDKSAVFKEMARVLRPGGRVAVSDIAIKRELPDDLATNIAAHVGCIAGAISIQAFKEGLAAAGFSAVEVMDSGADLNAYALVEGQSACCSPTPEPVALGGAASRSLKLAPTGCCGGEAPAPVHGGLADLLRKYDVNEFAASVKVYAVKG